MNAFEINIAIRWADIDQNRHVRHSAYYDYGAHARIELFKTIGFTSKDFEKGNFGPIIFSEQCHFIREIKPSDHIRINVLRGGISPNGRKWTLHHEIFNHKNEKCAHISLSGAWMDLQERKLTIPPTELTKSFEELNSGEYFKYSK